MPLHSYRDIMTSTGFNPNPEWHWPKNTHLPSAPQASSVRSSMPGAFQEEPASVPRSKQVPKPESHTTPKPRKHWPPRTCRICFETVVRTSRSRLLLFGSKIQVTYRFLAHLLGPAPPVLYQNLGCKTKYSSKRMLPLPNVFHRSKFRPLIKQY